MKVSPTPDYQNVAQRLSRRPRAPAFDRLIDRPEHHRQGGSQ